MGAAARPALCICLIAAMIVTLYMPLMPLNATN